MNLLISIFSLCSCLLFGLSHILNGSLLTVVFTFGIGLIFGFAKEYIKDLVYRPKGVYTSEEVFGPVMKLSPSKQNAFLFDKRIKG